MSSASSTKTKTIDLHPIRIGPELHRRLKIRCAELGLTMREFVEQLIRQALDGDRRTK